MLFTVRIFICPVLFLGSIINSCTSLKNIDNNSTQYYEVFVLAKESQATLSVVLNAFAKMQVVIMRNEYYYTNTDQIQYMILGRSKAALQLGALQDELMTHPEVMSVEIMRKY